MARQKKAPVRNAGDERIANDTPPPEQTSHEDANNNDQQDGTQTHSEQIQPINQGASNGDDKTPAKKSRKRKSDAQEDGSSKKKQMFAVKSKSIFQYQIPTKEERDTAKRNDPNYESKFQIILRLKDGTPEEHNWKEERQAVYDPSNAKDVISLNKWRNQIFERAGLRRRAPAVRWTVTEAEILQKIVRRAMFQMKSSRLLKWTKINKKFFDIMKDKKALKGEVYAQTSRAARRTPVKTASGEAASGAASGEAGSGEAGSGEAASEEAASGETASGQVASRDFINRAEASTRAETPAAVLQALSIQPAAENNSELTTDKPVAEATKVKKPKKSELDDETREALREAKEEAKLRGTYTPKIKKEKEKAQVTKVAKAPKTRKVKTPTTRKPQTHIVEHDYKYSRRKTTAVMRQARNFPKIQEELNATYEDSDVCDDIDEEYSCGEMSDTPTDQEEEEEEEEGEEDSKLEEESDDEKDGQRPAGNGLEGTMVDAVA